MSRFNGVGLELFTSLALMALAPARVNADFLFTTGNNPQPDENVLLGDDSIGMQVVGSTNQTSTPVLIESPSQFLVTPSSGQARVEARGTNNFDGTQVAIEDDIVISLQDPQLGFRSLIFNTFIGGRLGDDGDLSFTADGMDALGGLMTETFGPEDIENGSNFFTLTATENDVFTSVTIHPASIASYADLRQIRIGGIALIGDIIVPEPPVAMLLAALLSLGAVVRQSTRCAR